MAFVHPTNRFKIAHLKAFIKTRITSECMVVTGRMPTAPNRVIGITPVPGPKGDNYEGLFEKVAFRIECRGAENNIGDSEAIALDVDNIIIGAEENFEIGVVDDSVWCNEIGRVGGTPALMSALPDSKSRWTYVCTYYGNFSTDLGGE